MRWLNNTSIPEINITAATLNVRVLSFTFALCTLTCLLCGVAPASLLRISGVHESLKQTARQSGPGRTNRRVARCLIVTEIACCVLLLIGSGLLLHSFVHTLAVPLGFDPGHTLIVRTTFNRQRYASAERRHAVERMIEARPAALPGVSVAALTTHVPLADERQIGFVINGRPRDEFHWADNALVGGAYFRAMKIQLLQGRTFSEIDTAQAPLAAVVNQSMANQYWPNQDPIGKGFRWGGRQLTVIGVASDVHVEGLDKPVAPMIYNSAYQIESGATSSGAFIIRTRNDQDPIRLAGAVQNVIRSADRGLPVLGFSTLEQVASAALAIRRMSLALVGAFSVITLLLSLVGVYGVLSYGVTQRIPEMGLRLALGAKPVEIAGLVVAEGIRLAVVGIAIGVAVGSVATRYMSNLLVGVSSLDPVSFVSGAMLLLVVAVLGSYLPPRRASRVDPMVALRWE